MTTRDDMLKAGYVVSPNDCFRIPGMRMYPSGPGLPEYAGLVDVYVERDTITVYEARGLYEIKPIASYGSAEEFFAGCTAVSGPGLPVFSNSWD